MLIKFPPSLTSVIFNIKRARNDGYLLNCSLKQIISLVINQPILHRMGNCMGVKSMSPLSIELLFVILYNITALYHKTSIFNGNQVILTSN